MFSRPLLALFLCLSLAAEGQAPHKSAAAPTPAEDDHVYRNSPFAFRYQIPYGWVDRTKQMNEPPSPPATDLPSASDSTQGQVLLAIFERPPKAPGDTINSTVLIVSENASAYHGLKKAEDYLAPLTELTIAKGFKSSGDPEVAEIDGHRLVRANFAKPITDKLTMHQSTLVLLAKGQIISFTFIAGSEDEIDDLIDALHFAAKPNPH